MLKKSFIAMSVTVAAVTICSLYLVHSELSFQKEQQLKDKQIQIELLTLYTLELTGKLVEYKVVIDAIRDSGCQPPPVLDDKKDQTDL